jgi:hypothetical protein
MTTVLDIQRALMARGYDIGRAGADGLAGPSTYGAILKALERVPVTSASSAPTSKPVGLVPADWMPWAQMARIVVHWTGGGSKASATDKKHYNVLIEGDAKLVRGNPSIALNQAPVKPGYAAHTLNCNSGSIGVSLCGMAGAQESPFRAGSSPLTKEQWDILPGVLADLCRRYGIPVTPSTVLSHAEVQATLGIKQRGKWDIARLPFDPSVTTAKAIGDQLRARVRALL